MGSEELEFDEAYDHVLADLSDDELEEELTSAASNPELQADYEMLLAERDRRRDDS